MAITTIRTTCSLDVETVRTLERMAAHWKVSKSEALRRAIKTVAQGELQSDNEAIRAWKELQSSLNLTREQAEKWQKEVRAERRAWTDRVLKRK